MYGMPLKNIKYLSIVNWSFYNIHFLFIYRKSNEPEQILGVYILLKLHQIKVNFVWKSKTICTTIVYIYEATLF